MPDKFISCYMGGMHGPREVQCALLLCTILNDSVIINYYRVLLNTKPACFDAYVDYLILFIYIYKL